MRQNTASKWDSVDGDTSYNYLAVHLPLLPYCPYYPYGPTLPVSLSLIPFFLPSFLPSAFPACTRVSAYIAEVALR